MTGVTNPNYAGNGSPLALSTAPGRGLVNDLGTIGHFYNVWDRTADTTQVVIDAVVSGGTGITLPGGEVHFALAYSEPEAGSDLAGLRTRASLRGDVYLVNGDKCWQSYAGHVEQLWLLARTGAQVAYEAYTNNNEQVVVRIVDPGRVS